MMNRREIKQWLDRRGVTGYTINKDLTVDVDVDVWLHCEKLTSIPVQFRKVSGSFYCDNNKLTSLKGCPREVCGNFHCHSNKLTSLKGCPEVVGGSFWCDDNNLTSLEGCPKSVGDKFYCDETLYNDPRYLRHLLKRKVMG